MSEITKSHVQVTNNELVLNMPISKVDKENRIVSGFATLDNVDMEDDLIAYEASIEAFEKFRGNVREMHQPIAVGKVISHRPDSYFDPSTGELYNGIFVQVRISKGAPDTWEKVLDGTLSAFSIQGPVRKADYIDHRGKKVRKVTKYDLNELSLVDNGGNQLANIMYIQKSTT